MKKITEQMLRDRCCPSWAMNDFIRRFPNGFVMTEANFNKLAAGDIHGMIFAVCSSLFPCEYYSRVQPIFSEWELKHIKLFSLHQSCHITMGEMQFGMKKLYVSVFPKMISEAKLIFTTRLT